MWVKNYSDELYHHGIKGQKWGVRRYQNADGTLTPAGKKRYNVTSLDGSKRKAYIDAKRALSEARVNKDVADFNWDMAYHDSQKLRNRFGKRSKAINERLVETAEASFKANKEYKEAKRILKSNKKLAKIEMKEVKTKYKEQCLKGQSALGRAWTKLTDGHNIYADIMYELNDGKYVEDN